MDIKFINIVRNVEQRLPHIEGRVQSLTSGDQWRRFESHLEDSESLMEQLAHLRHLPEPEQETMKQDLMLLTSHLGKWQVVKQLISIGVDPNCRLEASRQTPLQLAALSGHVRTTQALLSAPAIDANARDADGNTALMCAAQRGCYAVVAHLLRRPDHGSSVANSRGYTALDFALSYGRMRVLHQLQASCPEAAIDARLEKNPAFYQACCFEACERGWLDVLTYLDDHGVSLTSCQPESNAGLVFAACLYQHDEVLRFLHSKSVPLDRAETEGSTPIFVVCQNGNLAMVQFLCDAGCDINHRDAQGRTPAYMAASGGHVSVLRHLEERHCNLKAVTSFGDSLLGAAVDGGSRELFRHLWHHHSALRESPELRTGLRTLAHRAAGRLEVEILVDILQWDPDQLNRRDGQGNTPLLLACQRGCLPTLLQLKAQGADFSCANRKKKTPALRLSSVGNPALLRIVNEANGELNLPDWKGDTALLRATRFDHPDVVEFLIGAGCRVDARDALGRTAVFYAAQNCNVSLLQLLANNGAPLDQATSDGATPLLAAAQADSIASVRFLLASHRCRVEHVNQLGQSLASLCALNGNVDMLELATKSKADLHWRENDGNTPALNACLNGHLTQLRALESHGCYLDAKNYAGEGGLHFAARSGYAELARFLLEKKCNCNARDATGNTPLMIAAEAGHENLAQMLHEQGCDQHIRSGITGRNALHLACAGGHLQCVRYLLLIKCDTEQTDMAGATPLMLACESGSLETVDCLLQGNVAANNTLHFVDRRLQSCVHYAAKGGHVSVLKLLTKLSMSMDERNSDDETPLILAASGRYYQSVEFLVSSCNVSVTSVDINGRSAVHRAAVAGHLKVVKLLRDCDASAVDRPDKDGMTPLLLAAEHGFESVVTFLRGDDCGCDDTKTNRRGENSMHLAAKGGHFAVMRKMLDRRDLVELGTREEESCLTLLLRVRDCPDLAPSLLRNLDPKKRTGVGSTALQIAAAHGRVGALRCLLNHPNCDAGAVDSDGNLALHLAAREGHYESFRLLLKAANSEEPLTRNKRGQTALHLSCAAASGLCVDLLLERSSCSSPAMLDQQDEDGSTALICAVRAANCGIVQTLLSHGARQDIVDKIGFTAWRLAFSLHREELLDLLEAEGHPTATRQILRDAAEATGNPQFVLDALQGALKSRRFAAFVERFRPLFADAPTELMGHCSNGAHLLHACAEADLRDIAAALINSVVAGITVDYRDAKGQTPFLVAVKHNRTDLAKWLGQLSECDISAADAEGTDALMAATCKRNFDLVDWLLTSGARPGATDGRGRTALHWAAVRGSSRIFSRLLGACRDTPQVDVKMDADGMTAAQLAAMGGNSRMLLEITDGRLRARLMPAAGRLSPFSLACASGWCALANWLFRQGLCPDTFRWDTCMAAACSGGHLQMLRELQASSEASPLTSGVFLAAGRSGDLSLAVYLMSQFPTVRDQADAVLAGDLLASATAHGHLHLVRYLLLRLCVPADRPDRWGNLPCHVAALCGCAEALRLLLRHQLGDTWRTLIALTPLNVRNRSLLELARIGGSSEILDDLATESVVDARAATSRGAIAENDVDSPAFYADLGSLKAIVSAEAPEAPGPDAGADPTVAPAETESGIVAGSVTTRAPSERRPVAAAVAAILEKSGDRAMGYLAGTYAWTEDALLHECNSVDHAIVDKRLNAFDETLLILAARKGSTECVRILLRKSARVSTKDALGRTALSWASAKGFDAVLNVMRDELSPAIHREEANNPENAAMTPVMLAALDGHANVIDTLHGMGADLELQNTVGCTALILAAQSGHWEAVARLARLGANLSHMDTSGNSAIVWAARRGHADVLRELRQFGGRLTRLDWRVAGEGGRTAEQWAEACGHGECARSIRECIRKLTTPDPGTGQGSMQLERQSPVQPDEGNSGQQRLPSGFSSDATPGPSRPLGSEAANRQGPRYDMHPGNSLAIIVNIVDFPPPIERRNGAMADTAEPNLCQALYRLGFKSPLILQNLRSQSFTDLARHYFSDEEYHRCSSFLLCLMSHGELDYIVAADGQRVPLEAVFEQFRQHPGLLGKPKLFITQACRAVPADREGARARPGSGNAGRHEDSLYIYSVVPGDESHRDCRLGGVFAQTFRDVVLSLGVASLAETEFTHLLPRIVSRVAVLTNNEQISCANTTLRKLIYFPA